MAKTKIPDRCAHAISAAQSGEQFAWTAKAKRLGGLQRWLAAMIWIYSAAVLLEMFYYGLRLWTLASGLYLDDASAVAVQATTKTGGIGDSLSFIVCGFLACRLLFRLQQSRKVQR